MLRSLKPLLIQPAYKLQENNSLFTLTAHQYDEYSQLEKKYEALVLSIPPLVQNTPYILEFCRDCYFKFTIPDSDLFEDTMQTLIYSTRHSLMRVIFKTTNIKKVLNDFGGDKNSSFIFSQILHKKIFQWHSELDGMDVLTKELLSTISHKNVDIRPLYLEQYSTIEPYPKKLAAIQQQIAKKYNNSFLECPEILETYILEAYKQTKSFIYFGQIVNSGGDL